MLLLTSERAAGGRAGSEGLRPTAHKKHHRSRRDSRQRQSTRP